MPSVLQKKTKAVLIPTNLRDKGIAARKGGAGSSSTERLLKKTKSHFPLQELKNGGCSELGDAECFSINFLLKKDEIAIAYYGT